MLDKYLIPDRIFNNIYEITPDFLLSRGIKAVALDIDNTLVTYDDPEPIPTVLEWFDSLKNAGISIAFVSNNDHERVRVFNQSLGFYAHGKSGKPGGKYIREAMAHMGSDPKLIHAFPVLHPDWKESERVIDEMVEWFNEHSPKD